MFKKRFFPYLLIAFLLSAALISLFFLGDALFSLPLVPYDVFAWLTRVLPGPLVTFGIDRMVDSLTLLGLNVADTAKTAERMMSVGITLTSITLLLTVAFFILRDASRKKRITSLIPGVLIGASLIAIHLSLPFTFTENRLLAILWIAGLMLTWSYIAFWVDRKIYPYKEIDRKEDTAFAVEQTERRKFLIRLAETTAAITVIGAGISFAIKRGDDKIRGLTDVTPVPIITSNLADDAPAPGTRSEITPVDDHYLIDINPRPPVIDGTDYRLKIYGLVENELSLSLDQIRDDYQTLDQYVTLSCISNPIGGNLIGTTKWTGSNFQQILKSAGLKDNAKYLEIRSIDGYYESVALETIQSDDRIMLAYNWDDQPLTHEHGFPLRIWIPDLYGMKQPRWITEIEVTDTDQPGYWVERGWDKEARVKSTAVIDSVSNPLEDDTGSIFVPVGGIAYAGDRGISAVEVRVDNTSWENARIFTPLSETTWVIWRYDWPYSEGDHTFEVRCVDGDGIPQITDRATPHPSGASGIHSVDETF